MKKSKVFLVSFFILVMITHFFGAVDSYNTEINDISPTNLIPGENAELTFELENTGNIDLINIIFSWEEETGNILPVGLSNTQSIDNLDEGDSEEFAFNVFTSASAEAGLYELVLTVKFKDINGTTITELSKAGIIIGGQTDFDVSDSDISSSGVILSVANVGKNPAKSVILTIPEQSNLKLSGSSSSIIGNLDKGDYSIASFQILSFSRTSSNLNIEIQYTDTTGTRQALEKTIEIQSTSTTQTSQSTEQSTITGYSVKDKSSNNNFLIIGFIGSTIFTIIVIVFIVKKNRKKNESK
jgi:hypothetical protein